MSGYVRIHRKLLGHPVFRNDAEAMAFAWLVVRAAWRPCRVRYKDRLIGLDRGQLAVSVRDFAAAMDRDKAWIERLLKRLRAETMVETRNETGVNIVSICNYEEYQAIVQSRETPVDTEARQGRDTEQGIEEKEERERSSARYAFEGRTIKLNAKDFEEWRSTYHGIPDMKAELTSIDAWLQGKSMAERKRWFHSVPGMLGRKHQEALKPKADHLAYRNEPLRV